MVLVMDLESLRFLFVWKYVASWFPWDASS